MSIRVGGVIYNKVLSFLSQGSERTIAAKKNITISFGLKMINIWVSLQVIPLTINYINPSQYGIWLTLSSIIAWLAYFDLGFAHGFRNRFAEAKANGDTQLAQEYVSTTYAALFILFSSLFVVIFIINKYLNWSSILNVDISLNEELRTVAGLLSCFFCLNIIASVFNTMLMADQKPALASLIQTGGQLLAFIAIYLLTKTTSGNLSDLAFAFSGIPCLFLILASFAIFHRKNYKQFIPRIKHIHFSLVRNILGLGGQFFIIMISILVIYQFVNVIISRIEGPEVVTQYNIAYKYFNTLNMIASIVLTPFWSAFTDAFAKGDFKWMQIVQRKLELMWLLCIPLIVIMLFCSNYIYSWWIGDSVVVPFSLSASVALYVLVQILVGVYVTLINGLSKVRIQLLIYLSFSVISLPLMTLGCRYYGASGTLIIPICVCLFQVLLGRIQLRKLINGKATGLWNK